MGHTSGGGGGGSIRPLEVIRRVGAALGRSPKSLMRMLSPTGNPQARNLFEMIAYLQKAEGTVLEIRAIDAAAA
jgi:hypothetical protein